ncbi:MAG: AEC family transporter, partial [Fusobacteriaceae bacterium]
MENLIISMNAIIPLLLLVVLGYYLKKINLLEHHLLDSMNNLVFKIFIPILLFSNIYKTNLETAFNLNLLIFSLVGLCLVFSILFILVPRIEKDNRKRGVMIQGLFRSNFVILGLPIALALYDETQMGPVALAVAVVVPTYNILSVLALEAFRGGKFDIKKVLKGIIANPLIIGSFTGIFFLVSGIKVPFVLEKSLSEIGKIATPLGLILLGAGFKIEQIGEHLYSTILVIVGKLIIIPSLALILAIYFGFRDVE